MEKVTYVDDEYCSVCWEDDDQPTNYCPPAIREAAEWVEEEWFSYQLSGNGKFLTNLDRAIRDLMQLVRGEQPKEGEEP